MNNFTRHSLTTTTKQIRASLIQTDQSPRCDNTIAEYSQRKAIAATPTPVTDLRLSLDHPDYGLPERLVQNFAAIGVKSVYPWQSKCLLANGLIHGKGDLVYTAPTGGGKSLVAEILMLKKVIEDPEKKAILVLPYVALVQEKLRWLRSAVAGVKRKAPLGAEQPVWRRTDDESPIRVVGFLGANKSRSSWEEMDIAVCTIEKANTLVNNAIMECTVKNLGIVVMDELHMIDDNHRGYIMELMATKLLSLEQDVQLIGMSATLSNTEVFAHWLGGKYYISHYRPVLVEEYLVYENSIYPSTSSRFHKTSPQLNSQRMAKPQPSRTILASEHQELSSPVLNAVVALAYETARAGYGALVFCGSRSACEADALLVSRVISAVPELSEDIIEKRCELLNELRSSATGLDSNLEKTIPNGVAFHHAGLTIEERDLIASAYDTGALKVIVATCSLAAGINLPARRVILHGARMGRHLVRPSMLRQMRGRAGRKGKDEIGETYLCCEKKDLEVVAELIEAELPSVTSCLSADDRGIDRALLEVIATRLATSKMAVQDYIKKTLLYHSSDKTHLDDLIESTIDDLLAQGLITVDTLSTFAPTKLGHAVVASSFNGDMHALYIFTPVHNLGFEVNWQIFQREMESLDESGLRVLSFVGIMPAKINRLAQGKPFEDAVSADPEALRIYQRFYAAFQLRDLCNELPIHAVARKYAIHRGAIQNLSQTCHGFAVGMIKFCEKMGWGALAAALDHVSDRLRAGAKADLLQLAQVTYVKSRTARIFWEGGFKSVGAIASASTNEIMPILLQAQPRKTRLNPVDQQKYMQKLVLKAEAILKSANHIWERLMQEELEEE